jgi:hypothetical protein
MFTMVMRVVQWCWYTYTSSSVDEVPVYARWPE